MKNRKLEDRVFLMKPIKTNSVGKFIPYCNYWRHQGIVIHNNYLRCERKDCIHYIRLYIMYKILNSTESDENKG